MSVCPECAAGKHQSCDGTAWDNVTDAPAPCLCDDPAHVVPGLTQTPLADALENLRTLLVEGDSLLSLARFRTSSVQDQTWMRDVDDWIGRTRKITG